MKLYYVALLLSADEKLIIGYSVRLRGSKVREMKRYMIDDKQTHVIAHRLAEMTAQDYNNGVA
jgi:hypothetical protein